MKKQLRSSGRGGDIVINKALWGFARVAMSIALLLRMVPAIGATPDAADVQPAAAPAVSAASASAPAQDATDTGVALEEITVHARRVSESLERVPLAITAFTPEALAQQDLRSLNDLTVALPGIEACCGTTSQLIYVRGILNGAPAYFAEAPVPINGYDTYFDVTNITVLKGPQGTLFGQASNGGAFLFEPAKPGDHFGGDFEASAGTFGRRTVSGALDMPFFDGQVKTRIAAESFYREGYIKDLSNGLEYGDQNYYILRPSMTISISDNIENYTLYQYSHSQDSGNPYAEIPYDFNFGPTSDLPALGAQALVNGGNRAAFDTLRGELLAEQALLGKYQTLGLSVGCSSGKGPVYTPLPITSLNYHTVACPGDWATDNIFVNTTSWNFASSFTLKNILSSTWGSSFQQPIDNDASVLDLNDGNNFYTQPQSPRQADAIPNPTVWSDEVNLHGKAGIFDFTAGSFNTWRHQGPYDIYTENALTGSQQLANLRTSAWSHALYGQSNVDLDWILQGLTFTGGARFNLDQVEQESFNLNPTTLAVLGETGGPNSPAGHARFHNLSYNFSMQYQFNPDTMYYTTLSRGFSAGGLQNIVGFPSYAPAVLTNLEGGVKTTFDLGGIKARVNAEVFNGWYDNAQVTVYDLVTNSVTGLVAPTGVTENAARAIIRGSDIDFTLLFTHDFEVKSYISFLDAKYTHWPSLNPTTLAPIDLSSTPFRDAPKWKLGLTPTYHVGLGSMGDLSFNLNFNYRTYIVTQVAPEIPTNPANPRSGLICTRYRTIANGYPAAIADGSKVWVDCSAPLFNMDGGIEWKDFLGHENLTTSLTATNLTNNYISDTRSNGDLASGFTALGIAPPRMVYVTMKYKF